MKKYSLYALVLIIGLGLGWILFGGDTSESTPHSHASEQKKQQLWTCSMHPQIKKTAPGDCPICGMDLIPLQTDNESSTLAPNAFRMTDHAMALAHVQTSVVQKSGVEQNTLTLSGKLSENESRNVTQASYFSGRIEKLYISYEGQSVRQGQRLALIYSPELLDAQQELLTAAKMKTLRGDLYQAVRNKLKLWKLSDAQIQQIEQQGKAIEAFPIYAKVAGYVTHMNIQEGDYVKEGQPLFKIANLNSLWVNLDAYESQVKHLHIGMPVVLTTRAYPQRKFQAKISFIDPALNIQTRIVNVRAELPNVQKRFKPGMFVEATLTLAPTEQNASVTLPASAVLWTGKRSLVYVKPDAKISAFEAREVVLGDKIGTEYEVLSGLQPDEVVVTNGVFTVDAAAQLQGKTSMMNRSGDAKAAMPMHHHAMTDAKPMPKAKMVATPKAFQQQIKAVYTAYENLKDALVKDDSASAKMTAKQTLQQLGKVNMKLLKAMQDHKVWMPAKKVLQAKLKALSKTTPIAEQRKLFHVISNEMIQLVKHFGVGQTVYLQFCPMAADNQGAYWLSNEKKVRNPYYGASMLSCGQVKATIKK